ncbi:CC171 protein, partial [Neodrepanis coruscans]|nr:CC171 protein [Neodrepanis coruscans]
SPSEMATADNLRRKLQQAEKQNVELTSQCNQERSHYGKEIMKLQLELERGEATRQGLEQELSLARTETRLRKYSAEEELYQTQ